METNRRRYVLISRVSGNHMGSFMTRRVARVMKKMMEFEPMIFDVNLKKVVR